MSELVEFGIYKTGDIYKGRKIIKISRPFLRKKAGQYDDPNSLTYSGYYVYVTLETTNKSL